MLATSWVFTMARDSQAVRPHTTSVAQARLADMVKFSAATRPKFVAAARVSAALLLEHTSTFPYRGAQLWQLGAAGVVAWMDGTDEGTRTFPTVDVAREHYALVCADLAERPPRPTNTTAAKEKKKK